MIHKVYQQYSTSQCSRTYQCKSFAHQVLAALVLLIKNSQTCLLQQQNSLNPLEGQNQHAVHVVQTAHSLGRIVHKLFDLKFEFSNKNRFWYQHLVVYTVQQVLKCRVEILNGFSISFVKLHKILRRRQPLTQLDQFNRKLLRLQSNSCCFSWFLATACQKCLDIFKMGFLLLKFELVIKCLLGQSFLSMDIKCQMLTLLNVVEMLELPPIPESTDAPVDPDSAYEI